MYMPRTRDNPLGTLIPTKGYSLKASEAKEISLQNDKPSEMEMQGIYNTIRGAAKRGYRAVIIDSPVQRQAAMNILSNLGYVVTWLDGAKEKLRIEW